MTCRCKPPFGNPECEIHGFRRSGSFSLASKEEIKNAGITYLAAPYSHPDNATVLARAKLINRYAARFMLAGKIIFSPISHSHAIHVDGGLAGSWEFWERQDKAILKHCSEMIVLKLPGWDVSVGVTSEIKYATELGIPIRYIEDDIL